MDTTTPTNTPNATQVPPAADPANLSEADKALLESAQKAAAQAAATIASATAKADQPWYWNDFSKGLYLGVAVTAAAAGAYIYFSSKKEGE